MNYSSSNDWRNRRKLLNHRHIGSMGPFGPMHYPLSSYSTDKKSFETEIKEQFGDDILLSKFHMMQNPLQKNLADTIVTSPHNSMKLPTKTMETNNLYNTEYKIDNVDKNQAHDFQSAFSGIASFITGVFNVISGSFFQKRNKSDMECFDKNFDVCSQSFNSWQPSNFEDLNKNSQGDDELSSSNIDINNINHTEMLHDCRNAAEQCENKLDHVRLLLSSKMVPIPQKSKARRPHKIFVEPSSVEDNFEDAFSPEDFCYALNDSHMEYFSPYNIQNQEMLEVDAAITKAEVSPVQENMEIVGNIEVNGNTENKSQVEVVQGIDKSMADTNSSLVLSCEAKLNKLKALLQEKKDKCGTLGPASDSSHNKINHSIKALRNKCNKISTPKVKDKHFKNCHRSRTSKKSDLRKNMLDDMSFANEIDCDTTSTENSPSIDSNLLCEMYNLENEPNKGEYFDEVVGRFHTSSTTESDDSFQIVFSDSPNHFRPRKMSDCDSEDSFIVFEDSPNYCYTSTDVFGDVPSEVNSECSDSDSDSSDSGCGTSEVSNRLSHSLSRTVGDLTDDSLYDDGNKTGYIGHSNSKDETDSTPKSICLEIPTRVEDFISEVNEKVNVKTESGVSTGVLLDDAKKRLRQNQPPKKVQFSPQPPRVHVLRVWAFAARQARAGPWERHALDRERFRRRIADVEMAVSWVLKPQHRARIMFQRIMPWRNAQKRKELEEKKHKEEDEVINEQEKFSIQENEECLRNSENKLEGIKYGDSSILDHKDNKGDNIVDIAGINNMVVGINKNVVDKEMYTLSHTSPIKDNRCNNMLVNNKHLPNWNSEQTISKTENNAIQIAPTVHDNKLKCDKSSFLDSERKVNVKQNIQIKTKLDKENNHCVNKMSKASVHGFIEQVNTISNSYNIPENDEVLKKSECNIKDVKGEILREGNEGSSGPSPTCST